MVEEMLSRTERLAILKLLSGYDAMSSDEFSMVPGPLGTSGVMPSDQELSRPWAPAAVLSLTSSFQVPSMALPARAPSGVAGW